ncbi:hypothetical protein CCACVL1_09473 [Corchorus capsularis]|uniref:Uncharacterized protein n=1 Tax=Corchorus capsularis TaxID=210143 RepID=A0A1R3IW09_COCAP|nr:hypothetical protein CCACVL1_09473 [Corchorus capsularis]
MGLVGLVARCRSVESVLTDDARVSTVRGRAWYIWTKTNRDPTDQ